MGDGDASPPSFEGPGTEIPLSDVEYGPVAETANSLGLDMLAASGEGNVVISPASLAVALGMLAEGATNEGTAELEALLGVGGEERSRIMAALLTSLGRYSNGAFSVDEIPEEPFLRVANNAAVDDDLDIEDSYVDRLHRYYAATVQETDLGSAAGKRLLDEWVNEATEGLIEESAIKPDPLLRLVLQNAVLFAAQWAVPFDGNGTGPRPFTLADGTEVEVPTMHEGAQWRYAQADGHRALALPYTEGFTAYVVLPPEGARPVPATILDVIAAVETAPLADVRLALPQFDLASTTDVKDHFEGIGITHIFENSMSLRGIADEDLVVGAIAQQGRLIVDEEGTVGAAVTEIAVEATSALVDPVEWIEFQADRPFYFAVRHGETGLDLFQAWIGDPRG